MRVKSLTRIALTVACAIGLTVAGTATADAAPAKGKIILFVKKSANGEKAAHYYITDIQHKKLHIAASGTYTFSKAKTVSLPKGNYTVEVDSTTPASSAKVSGIQYQNTLQHRKFTPNISLGAGKTYHLTENSGAEYGFRPAVDGLEITTPVCATAASKITVTISFVTENTGAGVYIAAGKTSDPKGATTNIGGKLASSGSVTAPFDCSQPFEYFTIGGYSTGWSPSLTIEQVFRQLG